jgi:hypothetical protein
VISYAFTFSCYNLKDPDPEGYPSKVDQANVTVVAESIDLAEEDAKNVCPGRGHYKLEEIVELSDTLSPVLSYRY